ncbi:hypothetical protein BW892_22275 [Bacillus cereus]|uniref:Uncharacterized protein n=1 Tax=Bacillus cereus TaxID=1396 RepID=A0A1S9UHK6_BACCE|nr:hypothetical protein BW892_22275 [Bacillus cereus]
MVQLFYKRLDFFSSSQTFFKTVKFHFKSTAFPGGNFRALEIKVANSALVIKRFGCSFETKFDQIDTNNLDK